MQDTHQDKLIKFYQSKRRMPTYTEMLDLFGFKSKNAVARIVDKLVIAGVVTKDKLGKIIPTGIFDEIPMVGLVKAGLPAPGEALTDSLNIQEYLVPKRELTYLFEVDGDSMIEAHIADGDIVIAERATTARNGEIVIANVDGEFTMKYLRIKDNKIWLEPANKHYKPIYPERELSIVAIVRSVMRKY